MYTIRRATLEDLPGIQTVYQRAADGKGLARTASEVTAVYVAGFLSHALENGLSLVLEQDAEIVGEIHASVLKPKQFGHVLGELTIGLDPRTQGRGQGRALFHALFDIVRKDYPHVRRIELGCRESNTRAVKLYESLGFVIEARLKNRVWDERGFYEDDLIMGKDFAAEI
jgi:ribosomal protein S18 acetylase RimI-like enzyme